MRKIIVLPILICALSAFGCGLLDKFKTASNTNSNVKTATPKPTISATPTATPVLKLDDSPDEIVALGKNYLGFGAGTLVIANTSGSPDDTFTGARAINNEGIHGSWVTSKGQTENQGVTLELPARTTLKTLVIDNYYGYSKQQSVRDVRFEISDASPTNGFETILEATLRDGTDKQIFPVNREIAGRFLRYTALNNYGSPENTLTKEIRGYGEQEPIPTLQNLSGTYKYTEPGSFGKLIHLKQEGSSVIGCFEGSNPWTFQGTIEGRVMSYKLIWKYNFSGTNIFTPDGKKFTELTWARDKKSYDDLNFGEKISDRIGNCEQMPNLDGTEDTAKNQLEKDLSETGRTVLYGINFDFNSDVIHAESKPTLDKVVAILKEKSDWKMNVEGHTDNVGGASFNQTLSEKRAAAVKKYLTDAGINDGRLNSIGYGLSKPLAPNNSESERAQNRRVELVKQ